MKSPCRNRWRIAGSCSALLLGSVLAAQTPWGAAREWRVAHEQAILAEYFELLSIPNVASDTANIGRNADWIIAAMAKRGVQARKLAVAGAPPAVYGELLVPGATQTVMFYAHYDGQPVEPDRWTKTQPFAPKIIGDRIFARSASDDKAPIMAILAALDGMRARGLKPKSNLKFFFDGEEEAGSPHVREILTAHKDSLSADVWLFCDGPVHGSRRQAVVFGARGVVGLEITVYGPRRELHSGHYGNWAPNPAQMLVNLVASMRDDEGRVTIEEFGKGAIPFSAAEIAAAREAPDVAAELAAELALGRTLAAGQTLERVVEQPVLNLRGIQSAGVGKQSRNVVPSAATASFDIRLVKGMEPKAAVASVEKHLRARGYFVVREDPGEATLRAHPKVAKLTSEEGYRAVRTAMDLPVARRVIAAVEAARGPVLKIPTHGGSLPMAVFEDVLQKPLIIVPIVNHDNNQHSHDENLRLANLWDGIETLAALLGGL